MKVLLVEDDRAIGDMLTEVLTHYHWVVEWALDGALGLELTDVQEYDLILLDIGLPKVDGITVCKQLRSRGCQTPILLLTGQDSTEAQVAGLDAGADDYVTKPFNLDIILARMRAVVRKGNASSAIVSWGDIHVDSARGEVWCNNRMVPLRAKEFGLLELFFLNPKRIYSRRAILDHLWDVASLSTEATVSTHVKCVRQKLKAAGAADPIETVHGLGYRLRSQPANPSLSVQTPKVESVEPSKQVTNDQRAQAVATKVWQQFKVQYLQQIQALETLLHTLPPDVASSQQQDCQRLAHKFVGSLGMFGLSEASQQARNVELLMQRSTLDKEQIAQAIQWVKQLKQAITQAQHTAPPKLRPLPNQSSLSMALAQAGSAQILIVDDDVLLADRLRIEAIAWQLQVEIATDLTVARQMIDQHPPQIILLDLSFPGDESGLMLLQELNQRACQIPIVIFTAKDDMRDRISAAQLGAKAFLHKPLPAHEILKTVTDVLSRELQQPDCNRLLIVDDDPVFLSAIADQLSEHGLQVTTSSHPQEFWLVLATCNPNMLILDLEMPEFDGLELCQIVRTSPQWQHLKVVFLSAHTEPDIIAKAYAAGADDYISKSIPATDLITPILHRIGQA